MRTRFLLALCALSLATQEVYADIILPDVAAKYVSLKQINPTRDAGYVVGDVLDRTIILNVKKPYELVKESLPIEGYEHRYRGQISGIELIKISHKESDSSEGVNHELQLRYQVFTTGKLAIGAPIFVLKNWLFKAVNSNGAVSPLIRATANNMPVITPLLAARKVTMVDTFQRGAPNANAASRKLPGTKRNIFSVVRITTGIAINDKAKLPA